MYGKRRAQHIDRRGRMIGGWCLLMSAESELESAGEVATVSNSNKRRRRKRDWTPITRRARTFVDGGSAIPPLAAVCSPHAEIAIRKCHAVLDKRIAEIESHARKQFVVGLADPPWRFRTETVPARAPYPTMALETLKAMPVRRLFSPKSVMFMWAPPAMLPSAIELLGAWGFLFSTVLYWRKLEPSTGQPVCGLGSWARNSAEFVVVGTTATPPDQTPELLLAGGGTNRAAAAALEHDEEDDKFAFVLVGRRGSGVLRHYRTTHSFPQEISAPRPPRHSAKPPLVRQLLGDYLAVGPQERLELFARDQEDSRWAAWGLELSGYWLDAAAST